MLTVWRAISRKRGIAGSFMTFAAVLALFAAPAAWLLYSPGQDHIGAIPLDGDGSWYHNYEKDGQIQDPEVLYHNIGHSIESAREADIIFLGWSRLIFGLDWRVFEAFEKAHKVKMFNMSFAGVQSGEFSRRIIQKFGLHPKLWVINIDRDLPDEQNGFFYVELADPAVFGSGAPARVVRQMKPIAWANVAMRNFRWRVRMAMGTLPTHDSYRSARTGNWWLDEWPNYRSPNNPRIEPKSLVRQPGNKLQVVDYNPSCPALPTEIGIARAYLEAIGGTAVLIQVPSIFACAQRVQELANVLHVSSFAVDPTSFKSGDGGGHLDAESARRYSMMLFDWLERLPEFQTAFPDRKLSHSASRL